MQEPAAAATKRLDQLKAKQSKKKQEDPDGDGEDKGCKGRGRGRGKAMQVEAVVGGKAQSSKNKTSKVRQRQQPQQRKARNPGKKQMARIRVGLLGPPKMHGARVGTTHGTGRHGLGIAMHGGRVKFQHMNWSSGTIWKLKDQASPHQRMTQRTQASQRKASARRLRDARRVPRMKAP